jgi:hypothetical protein
MSARKWNALRYTACVGFSVLVAQCVSATEGAAGSPTPSSLEAWKFWVEYLGALGAFVVGLDCLIDQ